jgi:hypothetical protein
MPETGSYLYAVCRGITDADLRDVAGLRGQPLRVVEHRGLCAVVSDVPLAEFGDDGLREHLEDLAWLEEVARTHDAVVSAAAVRWPTAPLRLATICLADEGVRDRLDQWHEPLVRTLDTVEGRHEWSVKAFTVAAEATPTTAGTPSSLEPEQGAGAAYLRRRKADAVRRELAGQRLVELGDELHELLSKCATASRRLPTQDPRLTGHQGTMLLNGAYLVPADDAITFSAAAQTLREANSELRLELQGPWAPYSFVSLDDQ